MGNINGDEALQILFFFFWKKKGRKGKKDSWRLTRSLPSLGQWKPAGKRTLYRSGEVNGEFVVMLKWEMTFTHHFLPKLKELHIIDMNKSIWLFSSIFPSLSLDAIYYSCNSNWKWVHHCHSFFFVKTKDTRSLSLHVEVSKLRIYFYICNWW